MRIYGTLGPHCSDTETLRAMFDAGMTGIRLNLSHVTLHDAALQIEALQKAADMAGVRTDLLIDMQGPELRISAPPVPLRLTDGDPVILETSDHLETETSCIRLPAIVEQALVPGQEVLLDDGKILLEVIDDSRKKDGSTAAKVIRGGLLQGRKSIALPGAEIWPPTLTETDLINIRAAREYGVTGLMQPFVRDADDLRQVRAALHDANADDIRLLAKIENQAGTAHIDSLLPYADEFVIARGDLGNSMPLWELPAAQKRLAARIKNAGKDLMIVTQMLASMEHSPVPTRAEVSDIFNAVLDGADSVMVTGETAVGDYPVEVIRYLTNTAKEAERFLKVRNL
ncbi:MAG: pyruvate kinase [Lachnospiraceae bacterium]|nr:pyruvate kinase [Lachnospiraceae bacterium]